MVGVIKGFISQKTFLIFSFIEKKIGLVYTKEDF